MADEQSDGTVFHEPRKPEAADGSAGPSNGLAKKAEGADAKPGVRPDMSLFEHYHANETRKRLGLYGVAGVVVGAIAFEIARWTGPLIPEWAGVPLGFLIALPAWKASKHALRKLARADPGTPMTWREKPDAAIIRYASQRVADLSVLEQHAGWKANYALLKLIPDQLPQSLGPWRQANRDKERQVAKQKVYPESSADGRVRKTREAIDKAIEAAQRRSEGLDEVITQRLLIFDMVEAWFSAAQHTAGSDAAAIKTALESIKQINDDADAILQGVVGAADAATT
ncbi:hypothetical protein EPO34_00340 [Patescibacteria group bacterium]|nr:MAG: hypothetical protein EPO34_00340 [Patescibacteria group bacterium]